MSKIPQEKKNYRAVAFRHTGILTNEFNNTDTKVHHDQINFILEHKVGLILETHQFNTSQQIKGEKPCIISIDTEKA